MGDPVQRLVDRALWSSRFGIHFGHLDVRNRGGVAEKQGRPRGAPSRRFFQRREFVPRLSRPPGSELTFEIGARPVRQARFAARLLLETFLLI